MSYKPTEAEIEAAALAIYSTVENVSSIGKMEWDEDWEDTRESYRAKARAALIAAHAARTDATLPMVPSEEATLITYNAIGGCKTLNDVHNILRVAYAIDGRAREPEWQPIESAPKGYPSLEEPSEWFIAIGKNSGPKGAGFAIIRRVFGHGFGPWEGTGDEYYCADFFTHWQPLPTAPVEKE